MAFLWIIGCVCSYINTERNSIHIEQFHILQCLLMKCKSTDDLRWTVSFPDIRLTWTGRGSCYIDACQSIFMKCTSIFPSNCISPRFWMFLLWRSTASWGAMLKRTRSRGKADTAMQKLVQAVEAYGNIFTSYSPRWKNWACLRHENPTCCQTVYTLRPFFFFKVC